MKETTTYGLSPERLACLLALALQDSDGKDGAGAGQIPSEIIENMLARKLPLDPATPDSLPAILNRPFGDVLVATGLSIGELLLDNRTGVTVIKALRDHHKQLVRHADSEAQQIAATVVYYAAIASALVFQRHKITNLSYRKLEEAYADLEKEPWAPSELRDLFNRAKAVCQQREPKPE